MLGDLGLMPVAEIVKALNFENQTDAVKRARETGLIPDQNYI